MKNNTLSSLETLLSGTKSTATAYGKIEGDFLLYKGKYYKIENIAPETLFIDANTLFGQHGDEFPLNLVR